MKIAIYLYNRYKKCTNMEGNIRIYRLLKGLGTDRWKWYCPSRRRVKYHLHRPYHDPSLSCLWHYNSIWFDPTGILNSIYLRTSDKDTNINKNHDLFPMSNSITDFTKTRKIWCLWSYILSC